jgi:hypothetical protein
LVDLLNLIIQKILIKQFIRDFFADAHNNDFVVIVDVDNNNKVIIFDVVKDTDANQKYQRVSLWQSHADKQVYLVEAKLLQVEHPKGVFT